MPPSRPIAAITAADALEWQLPAKVPAELAPELPALIAGCVTALQPANHRDVAVVLGRLAAHYPPADRTAGHHSLTFEDAIRDLAEYPIAVISEAAAEWRRTQRWAPRICELRTLCDEIVGRRRRELLRLQFLAWCAEAHGGHCPRLLRRIGDRFVDYRDLATACSRRQCGA